MAAPLRTLAALAVVLGLVACTGLRRDPPESPALTWPPAPDLPRIAFVRTFSQPGDLGISRGVFERLQDVLLGEQESRLVRPMAVVAVNDVIYVADPGVRGVHRFDPAGGSYALIQGPASAPLPSPVGLAAGAAGEVYVTDSKLAQVFVIHPGAKSATPLQLGASLGQPTGVAFDPEHRRLFVVDTTAHRILVFGPERSLVATIGRRGDGDGEFNYPTLLWRSKQGRLYVTDSLNFRVQILDADGAMVGSFGRQGDGAGDAARPKGVATDRYGHVYVADSLLHSVQIFDEAGRFLLPVGQQGQARGEFWLPTGVFVSDDEHIYVADSYNRRVQVLRYVGGAT